MTARGCLIVEHARRESGQSLVESALIIPLILLMFMGTVDVGRIVFSYIGLEEAVQEGATYGSHLSTATANWAALITARVTGSADHAEVKQAVVTPICDDTPTTPPKPVTLKVSATYEVPSITPFGVPFGGKFPISATVIANYIQAEIDGSCGPL